MRTQTQAYAKDTVGTAVPAKLHKGPKQTKILQKVPKSLCYNRSRCQSPKSTTEPGTGGKHEEQPPSTGPGKHHRTEALTRAADESRHGREEDSERPSAGDAPRADLSLDLAILPEDGRRKNQAIKPDIRAPHSLPAGHLA